MRKLALGVLMSLLVTFPSFASQSYFNIEPDYNWEDKYTQPNSQYTLEDLAEDFTEWQRRCAPYSSCTYLSADLNGNKYVTNGTVMLLNTIEDVERTLLQESAQMKIWLDYSMPLIVPEGTNKNDAIKLIYDWIQSNMQYEASNTSWNDELKEVGNQVWNPVRAVQTGKANCAGYTSLFRAMTNYLIFDDNWTVRYIDETQAGPGYNKPNMMAINGNGHCWNVLADTDGYYKYFDVTFDDDDETGVHHYDFFNKNSIDFYNDIHNGQYVPKVFEVTENGRDYSKWIRGTYKIMEFFSEEANGDQVGKWK